jgi:hypothetical protein
MGQIFLGQNGNKILNNVQDYFSLYFDCQITKNNIFTNTETPKTIYLKTDFLPIFVHNLLPKIKNSFILITACSDYSPEYNFPNEYKILIDSDKVVFWFMNNMKSNHEKTFSLPCGLAAGQFWQNCKEEEVDSFLIELRNQVSKEQKIDKVFCCFRTKNRNFNVCGEDMIIRPQIMKLIVSRTDLFDFYEEDSLNFKDFVRMISKYKYSLCPHGNGMDPNPNSWLSLIVFTTPVIYKTVNSTDMFKDIDSVIFFEKFEELLDKNLYKEKPEIDFDFLTNKYWANKIKNKLQKID